MVKTNEDYIYAIKLKIEVQKNGVMCSYLTQPSPAQLRNLSLMLLENGLNANDENGFRNFFQTKKEEDLKKCINHFDIEKFKPIISFLKRKTTTTNSINLELIAIMVDFEDRPLFKFLNMDKILSNRKGNENQHEIISFLNIEKSNEIVKSEFVKSKIKLIFKIVLSFFLLFIFFYLIKKEFFQEKECMQWQKDHFEPMKCEINSLGFAAVNEIKTLDKNLLGFKKINVNPKTIFFKNEKPIVWYFKKDGQLEFFNAPGFHPENGKPLKPISKYMIKKYVIK